MQNKYQVKIDDSVMPELYTFDQLIDEGLLDEVDEKIKVRLNGENVWQIARNYPFADVEAKAKQPNAASRESQSVYQSRRSVPNASQHDISSEQYCRCEYIQRKNQRTMPMYPSIVDKWNWGAFTLSWIWGIFNGLYWPLIIIALNFIPYIGVIISLCICVLLGKNGNLYAWRKAKPRGESVEHFNYIQFMWNTAGQIGVIVFMFLFLVLLMI